jgi:hypothetical protein
MQVAVERAIVTSGYRRATVGGLDCMWLLRFDRDEEQSRFLELALREGVIFKRGAYNFASLAHDDHALDRIERAATAAFHTLAREAA